jgi:hypothetical protein
LYGSRYFSSLAHLPPAARQSITSSGLLTADKGPKCSDGVVFSQFLAGLFSNVVPEDVDELTQTYAEVTEKLARQLVAYLLARRALLHPAAGKIVHMPSSINMVELAVLVQNNRYKLPASEIEQRVFVRGGLQGDARDILDGMGVVARAVCTMLDRVPNLEIHLLSASRNQLKRAHEIVAQRLLERLETEEVVGEEK